MADKGVIMRCVIIAGSPDTNSDFLSEVIKPDDYVICADRGCNFAKQAGITPNLVVGDFDSEPDVLFPNCETVRLIPEKDDTDTMLSVDLALEKRFDEIAILGALGGRFDHSFANVAVLSYIHEHGSKGVLLSEKEKIEFLPVGHYEYKNFKGKTFSLFPFGCPSVCVSYSGTKYPLEKYCVSSSVTLGVSNVFTSDMTTIDIYDGNAILIINLIDC